MSNKNSFTGRRLEFHILQSFPVSCLNRDDMGAPKSVKIGGVNRARVSSQCWKRAVRMQMHELGCPIAKRTKLVAKTIADECIALGATQEQAMNCGERAAQAFTKTVKEGVSDTLFFISDSEAKAIATAFKEKDFQTKTNSGKESNSEKETITDKEIQKITKNAINPVHDGVDIALFGRMVANATDMNVEAAASFAHAISIHEVNSEVDFFTAVDDCKVEGESGSAHMGSLEYNSATYYRYVSLDLGQLAQTLKTENIEEAIKFFVSALFLAVPTARQTTMTATTPWDFAIVTLRKGQRMQIPFTIPVNAQQGIIELKKRFEDNKTLYGSMFGLEFKTEIGIGYNNFDEMLESVLNAIKA